MSLWPVAIQTLMPLRIGIIAVSAPPLEQTTDLPRLGGAHFLSTRLVTTICQPSGSPIHDCERDRGAAAKAVGRRMTSDFVQFGPRQGSHESQRYFALMDMQRKLDSEMAELMRQRRIITTELAAYVYTVPEAANL